MGRIGGSGSSFARLSPSPNFRDSTSPFVRSASVAWRNAASRLAPAPRRGSMALSRLARGPLRRGSPLPHAPPPLGVHREGGLAARAGDVEHGGGLISHG